MLKYSGFVKQKGIAFGVILSVFCDLISNAFTLIAGGLRTQIEGSILLKSFGQPFFASG
jgi:hypothetical protein